MKKLYVLYDARVRMGLDTDDAAILVNSDDPATLREDSEAFAKTDSIWAEYDIVNERLVNEKLRPQLHADVLRSKSA